MYVIKIGDKYVAFRTPSDVDLYDVPERATLYSRWSDADARRRRRPGDDYYARGPMLTPKRYTTTDMTIWEVTFSFTEKLANPEKTE